MTNGDRATLRALEQPPKPSTDHELMAEIRDSIERLNDRFDEFARVFLNAKFPHGKPVDRWARR
jgi:hypothetical protein